MEQPDERMWELEISQCDDGDILIEQGRCGGCGDDAIIRLHRCHIPLIAELGGFVPANDVDQTAERLQYRLNIMASLVRAHTKPGEPLRVVVDDLMADRQQSTEKPLTGSFKALRDDGCLPSDAGCSSGLPEHHSEDLFADKAGRVQE